MRAHLAFASLSLIFLTGAAGAQKPPSIAGMYRFVSRVMPDGSKQVPPMIDGLLTYTQGYRNFNVYWKDAAGKEFSVSYGGTYELTPLTATAKGPFGTFVDHWERVP